MTDNRWGGTKPRCGIEDVSLRELRRKDSTLGDKHGIERDLLGREIDSEQATTDESEGRATKGLEVAIRKRGRTGESTCGE